MLYDRYIALCKNAGLSPTAAAIKAGINKGTISVWKRKWEQGIDVDPDKSTIDKLRVFFNVNSAYLLGMTDNPTPSEHLLDITAEENGLYEAVALSKNTELAQKNTAAPKDDGITDYIDLASRRIKCAHPLSILAAQYSVPAFLMQQLIGCDFNRAEGLILGRYQPTPDELLRAAEGFGIPYEDLEQGWIPLSANPEVLARFTSGRV